MRSGSPPPENSIRIVIWVFKQHNYAVKTAKATLQQLKNQHIKIMECSRHPPDLNTIKTSKKELRIQMLLWQLLSLKDYEVFALNCGVNRVWIVCQSCFYLLEMSENNFYSESLSYQIFKTIFCKGVKYLLPMVFYNLFFLR